MKQIQKSASPVTKSDEFLLCGCQPGAEVALREQASRVVPGVRPGVWRRGVVTFRLPEAAAPSLDRLAADLVFARTVVHSLGQVTGDDPQGLARAAVDMVQASDAAPQNVHVWNRVMPAGPGAGEAVQATTAARRALLEALGIEVTHPVEASRGERVLDCVIDTPTRWWMGWHSAGSVPSRWPGGFYPADGDALPAGVVSRAWLKLDEAIRIFEIPFAAGQRVIELGASPGGACQRLLEAGMHVVGVDPALVDPVVAARPRFTQWRMRAREVPLDRFHGCDWLVSDMSLDPKSTLAALGRVATARGVRLSGIVATLKITDWSRAAELAGWLDTIRSWGFEPRARQLSTSGREIAVVALPRVGGKTPRQEGRPASRAGTKERATGKPPAKPLRQDRRPPAKLTRRPSRPAKRPRAE